MEPSAEISIDEIVYYYTREEFEGKPVRSVDYLDEGLIDLVFDDGCFSLTANAQCCSKSFLVLPSGENWYTRNEILGEMVEVIREIEEHEKDNYYPTHEKYHGRRYSSSKYYEIECQSGKIFDFSLQHFDTDGYYRSFLGGEWISFNEDSVYWGDTKVVMVVGLPGAGKTLWSRENWSTQKNAKIYDDKELIDEIHSAKYFFNEPEGEEKLETVCFVSASFTDIEYYTKFLFLIGSPTVEVIETYCFTSEPAQSIVNKAERENEILDLADLYEPDSRRYINPVIIPTYRPAIAIQ